MIRGHHEVQDGKALALAKEVAGCRVYKLWGERRGGKRWSFVEQEGVAQVVGLQCAYSGEKWVPALTCAGVPIQVHQHQPQVLRLIRVDKQTDPL